MGWSSLARLVLAIMNFGLCQELCRNLIIKRRENGEDVSWGIGYALLACAVSFFPLSAVLVIMYSAITLQKMGLKVKLCLWMPREFFRSLTQENKLKRLERIAEFAKAKREKLAQDLKDQSKTQKPS